jgi:hypothetical protein
VGCRPRAPCPSRNAEHRRPRSLLQRTRSSGRGSRSSPRDRGQDQRVGGCAGPLAHRLTSFLLSMKARARWPKVNVPRGPQFTFTCMEPTSPDHREEPLTVSFDDVQGPYRRRIRLAGLLVVALILVLVAAWRLASRPRSDSPRPSGPNAVLQHGRRRPSRPRVAVKSPSALRRSRHRAIATPGPRGQHRSATAPNVIPPRPTSDVVVGPPRPPSDHRVGQREQRQFQYLGR